MKRHIYSILAASLLLGSCSEKDIPEFPTNSSVEENEDSRISSFDIDPALLDGELISRIGYANLKKGFFSLETYNAELRHLGSSVRCGLHLSSSANLEDGVYLLTFSETDGRPLEGMLRIEVKDDRVMKVSEAKGDFSLRKGSGTKDDPYQIGSARDFLTFLDDLRENELTNGRDVWFQQTADIELMDQSSTKPGRGYFGYSFAGHYDGGGHALKGMFYRGAESQDLDIRIGIFPGLLDGASVSNLTVSGVNISATYTDTGALAGTAAGTVSLSGITVSGSLMSDKATNTGAFIGRLEQGHLSATDLTLSATVIGHINTGGVIGYLEKGSAELSGISDFHFLVEGYESTGGIVGKVNDCTVSISDSELRHAVSQEDSDIRLVSTTGGDNTGGIIGHISGGKNCDLRNVEVSCPVGGIEDEGNKVGGLIGNADGSGILTIDGSRITSIVAGNKEIGGYIGHCGFSGNGKLVFKGNSRTNFIIPDNSAAGIEGKAQVGGVIGYLTGRSFEIDTDASVRVGINVKASEADCGGVIGKVYGVDVSLSVFDMTSATMQVNGVKNTGGMIGYAGKSTISGNTSFDYEVYNDIWIRIPETSDFPPLYKGIVKGQDNSGGILGSGENVTLRALASGCTVSATSGDNIGGIAGSIITSGAANQFEDLVSLSMVTAAGSNSVGGVIGYLECDKYNYATDLINYGSVLGGTDTGGIIGKYKRLWQLSYYDSEFKPTDLRWCLNQGEVSGANRVGGITGHVHSSLYSGLSQKTSLCIYHCGNNGTISSGTASEAASGIGGIVGYADAHLKLEDNANNGTIKSSAAHKGVGGIAGSLGEDALKDYRTTVMNVQLYKGINTGTIDSSDPSSRVGGILGFMEEGPDSYLKECANYGEVLHKHNSDNGGILGYVDHLGKIYNCVNIGNVEEGNATIGTHKTGSTFNHDGLYLLDGSGWTWPSGIVIKKDDRCDKDKYSKLDFYDTWLMLNDFGPIPTRTYTFMTPVDL